MKKIILITFIIGIILFAILIINHFKNEKTTFIEPNNSNKIVRLEKGESLQASIWITNDNDAKVKTYYFGNDNSCMADEKNGTYEINGDSIIIKIDKTQNTYSYKNVNSKKLIINNITYIRKKNCN